MRIHEVRFPNYRVEIATEKRTLFHMTIDGQWKVGDGLQICRVTRHPLRVSRRVF